MLMKVSGNEAKSCTKTQLSKLPLFAFWVAYNYVFYKPAFYSRRWMHTLGGFIGGVNPGLAGF